MQINNINMNPADIVIAVIVVSFSIMGFIKGAVRQFFSILSLGLAAAAAVVIPRCIKLPHPHGIPDLWIKMFLGILIWMPAFLVFNAAGKFLAGRIGKNGTGFSGRVWGCAFGGIKGLIIVLLALFFLDTASPFFKGNLPGAYSILSGSRVLSAVSPYNPFSGIVIVKKISVLFSAVSDPDTRSLMKDNAEFYRLYKERPIKDIVDDEELHRLLLEGRYMEFFNSHKIKVLMRDRRAVAMLIASDI